MKLVSRFFLICFWLFLSGVAHAQLYAGITGGQSELGTNSFGEVSDVFPDEATVTYRAYLGNRLSEKISYEVGYVDFGSFEFGERSGVADDTLSISGFDAAIVGRLPIRPRFLVFGRLGVYDWQGERRVVDDTGETVFFLKTGKVDVSLATGVEARLSKYIGVTLEVSYYRADELANAFYGLGAFFTF